MYRGLFWRKIFQREIFWRKIFQREQEAKFTTPATTAAEAFRALGSKKVSFTTLSDLLWLCAFDGVNRYTVFPLLFTLNKFRLKFRLSVLILAFAIKFIFIRYIFTKLLHITPVSPTNSHITGLQISVDVQWKLLGGSGHSLCGQGEISSYHLIALNWKWADASNCSRFRDVCKNWIVTECPINCFNLFDT